MGTVAPNLEIRRLKNAHRIDLVKILEINQAWEKLMSNVREDAFNFDDTKRKYDFNDISLIRSASDQLKRFCSEIFLDEWGTSGRQRPTVKLLLEYLIEAELYRAADYVAVELLNEAPPERPKTGPKRKVSIGEITDDTASGSFISDSSGSFYNKITMPCDGSDTCEEDTIRRIFPFIDVSNLNRGKETDDRTHNIKIDDENIMKISYEKLKKATNNFNEKNILGSGSFGCVYFGKVDGTELAIKMLNKFGSDHFAHELVILSQFIDHVNLLPPFAVCDDESLCLIYKYMPNGSLEDRLAVKLPGYEPLTWPKRVLISSNIAEGLQYLQSLTKPIIHCDIKTSNILLDADDIAKIGDFGLVRVKNSLVTSVTSTVQGTFAYMSPEAIRGNLSLKMDIFSFGVILLELLTGLPVLDDDKVHLIDLVDEAGTIEKLLDSKAGDWNKEVANKLHDAAHQCLKVKSKERPTAVEVNNTIKELVKEINA